MAARWTDLRTSIFEKEEKKEMSRSNPRGECKVKKGGGEIDAIKRSVRRSAELYKIEDRKTLDKRDKRLHEEVPRRVGAVPGGWQRRGNDETTSLAISGLAGFIYTQSCRIIGSPPPT